MGITMSYNESAALSAVYYSFGAYCDADCLNNWNCQEFCPKRPHFAIHTVVVGKKYELQAFTGFDKQSKQIVISFRGSKSSKNVLLDLDWQQMYFKEGETYDPGEDIWAIHKGFYWGLRELYDEGLNASIHELFAKHQGANVLLTGHSLGGALAQMLALMFATSTWPTVDPLAFGHVDIITFGSPRWGSKDVVTYFNTLPHTNWRVVNKYDMIPTGPWESMGDYGYYHPKREVQYTEWGTLKHQICDGDGERTTSSNCAYAASYNQKYHLYYLNVFEDECGANKPKDEWFSQPCTTLHTTENPHTSALHDINLTTQTSTTNRYPDEHEQKKHNVTWMVVGVVCGAVFGCLLTVLCCFLGVELYDLHRQSKRKDDQNDDYAAIIDT